MAGQYQKLFNNAVYQQVNIDIGIYRDISLKRVGIGKLITSKDMIV